jgi:hypothetical protein
MPAQRGAANPIKKAVGASLRALRDATDRTVPELVRNLSISASTYYRIEAGRDMLQPKHGFQLVDTLRDTGLDWARLSHVLAAVYAIDEHRNELEFVEKVIDGFRIADEELFRSLAATLPYWDESASADGREAVNRAAAQLHRYVTSSSSAVAPAPDPAVKIVADRFANVSPIYFDIVLDQLERLQAVDPRIEQRGMAQWERANARRFKQVFCVTQVPELLEASANSNVFDWGYLWRKRFGGVFVLLHDSPNNAARLQDSLRASLLRRGASASAESASKEAADAVDKVHVKAISAVETRIRTDLLQLLVRGESSRRSSTRRRQAQPSSADQPKNAWFFQIDVPRYTLGYVDDASGGDQEAAASVLSWEKSLKATDLLEAAWRQERDRLTDARFGG